MHPLAKYCDCSQCADAELMEWLVRHKELLECRDAGEVAYLAIMADFPRSSVYRVVPHWIVDRLTHSKYADRLWFYIQREIDYLTPLKDQWDRLVKYEKGQD